MGQGPGLVMKTPTQPTVEIWPWKRRDSDPVSGDRANRKHDLQQSRTSESDRRVKVRLTAEQGQLGELRSGTPEVRVRRAVGGPMTQAQGSGGDGARERSPTARQCLRFPHIWFPLLTSIPRDPARGSPRVLTSCRVPTSHFNINLGNIKANLLPRVSVTSYLCVFTEEAFKGHIHPCNIFSENYFQEENANI